MKKKKFFILALVLTMLFRLIYGEHLIIRITMSGSIMARREVFTVPEKMATNG